MARRCVLSGKGVLSGNNVSHANNRTRRRFLPNIQNRRIYSEALGGPVRLRLAVSSLRTIEKHGGLDAYLEQAKSNQLGPELRLMKKRIDEARGRETAA